MHINEMGWGERGGRLTASYCSRKIKYLKSVSFYECSSSLLAVARKIILNKILYFVVLICLFGYFFKFFKFWIILSHLENILCIFMAINIAHFTHKEPRKYLINK